LNYYKKRASKKCQNLIGRRGSGGIEAPPFFSFLFFTADRISQKKKRKNYHKEKTIVNSKL